MKSRELFWIIVLILVLLVVGTGIAYAAGLFSLSIPNTVRVTSAVGGVEVFSDPSGTNLVTSIDWGTLVQRADASRTFYVKNVGGRALYIKVTTDLTWGRSLFFRDPQMGNAVDIVNLDPGDVVQLYFGFTVPATQPAGIYNFSLNLIEPP